MRADFLIVGQGVAGSVLAQTLDRLGCRVVVANAPGLPSSSRVAAGIVNPLTGRKLVRTWRADELFPFLHQFYRQAEADLDASFFRSCNIYRPYRSEAEKAGYVAYTSEPEISKYVSQASDDERYNPYISNPHGGLTVTQSGWLVMVDYVDSVRRFFREKRQYLETTVDTNNLVINDSFVEYDGDKYGKVLFCDGVLAHQNPLFAWLPFNPVKGQILTVHVEEYPIKSIVNQGVFILPIDATTLKIGATYTWHDLDWQTTDDGRTFLQRKVAELLTIPYRIIDQQAGIRPAVQDRRPLVGLHPAHPAVGLFGGMGSKGVSLAPYLADQFARHLLHGEELDPEVRMDRYFSLYQDQKNV